MRSTCRGGLLIINALQFALFLTFLTPVLTHDVQEHTLAENQQRFSQFDIGNFNTAPMRKYMCIGLCTYKCYSGTQSNFTDCSENCINQYDKDTICKETDLNCWRKCGKFLDQEYTMEVLAPGNLSVSYEQNPEASPHIVQLEWPTINESAVWLVASSELHDHLHNESWASPGKLPLQPNSDTTFSFKKPSLCSFFKISVGMVRSLTNIEWTYPVVIQKPIPYVRNPLPPTLVDLRKNDRTKLNGTISADIQFSIPPGWSTNDLQNVTVSVHSKDCPGLPQPLLEILFPNSMLRLTYDAAYLEQNCCVTVSLKKLKSACNTEYTYPKEVRSLTLNISCGNIKNVPCNTNDDYFYNKRDCPISHYCLRDQLNLTVFKPPKNVDQDLSGNCSEGYVNLIATWREPSSICKSVVHYTLEYGELVQQQQLFRYDLIKEAAKPFIEDGPEGKNYLTNLQFVDAGPNYYFSVCAIFDDNYDSMNPSRNKTFNPDTDIKYASAHYCDDEANRPAHRPSKEKEYKGVKGSASHSYENSKEISARKQLEDKRLMLAAVVVPVVITLVAITAGVSYFCWRRRQKRRRRSTIGVTTKPEIVHYETGNDYMNLRPGVKGMDKWELPRERLMLFDFEKPLGVGAFGKVYRGKVIGKIETQKDSFSKLAVREAELHNTTVAVKQCFEYADVSAKSDFRQEIALMENLGYHPHLVNMLYKITDSEPYSLIVEFCEFGDLRHYLRDVRAYMLELERMGVNLLDDSTSLEDVDDTKILSLRDVYLFCFQIADGLEYLHQKNVIHRDIAARNVLVDKSRRCKIGDFGLCRFVDTSPIYMSRGGKLPIKWMSPEALKEFRFTRENDVWSFGVVLFEVITLGGIPYPDVLPIDGNFQKAMIEYLDAGKRMLAPDNCPEPLYKLMLGCWYKSASERPNISQIRENLRILIEALSNDRNYHGIYLDSTRDYYNVLDPSIEDDSKEGEPSVNPFIQRPEDYRISVPCSPTSPGAVHNLLRSLQTPTEETYTPTIEYIQPVVLPAFRRGNHNKTQAQYYNAPSVVARSPSPSSPPSSAPAFGHAGSEIDGGHFALEDPTPKVQYSDVFPEKKLISLLQVPEQVSSRRRSRTPTPGEGNRIRTRNLRDEHSPGRQHIPYRNNNNHFDRSAPERRSY